MAVFIQILLAVLTYGPKVVAFVQEIIALIKQMRGGARAAATDELKAAVRQPHLLQALAELRDRIRARAKP